MGRFLVLSDPRERAREGLSEVEDKKMWFGHFLNRVAKPFATQA